MMPIYEFHCKKCQRDFKALRRLDEIKNVTCPECGARKIIRLLSVTAQTVQNDDACAMPGGCCRMNPDSCACRN